MLKSRIALMLALLFSLLAQTAHGFLDPPYITPEHPVAGETVSVNIYGGVCDAIGSVPGFPQVTQDGPAIRILLLSSHHESPELCFWPVGTATNAVGAYASGSYTLQVDRIYPTDIGNTGVETLGVIPFVVAGGVTAPVPTPALDQAGLSVLLLTLAVAAALRWRRHGPRSSPNHFFRQR